MLPLDNPCERTIITANCVPWRVHPSPPTVQPHALTDQTWRRWAVKNQRIRAALAIARIGLFVGCFASTASPANGQVLYGGVTGTVTDASGAPVPGAIVTVTHKDTNLSREAVSNETGIYTFTNVQAGTYNVK